MMQTIGQRLKAEREEKHLTLDKVFEATRIRIQYLQALEADDLSVMPSPVQARGYLRNYAEYLGFDVDRMLEEMRAISARQGAGEIIGPMDTAAPMPPPESESPDVQPQTPTPELSDVIQAIPASVDQITVPIKPKPARRKRADSPPEPLEDAPPSVSQRRHVEDPALSGGGAAAEPTTRRRGRKKVQPEATSPVETAPQIVGEAVTAGEPVHPPDGRSQVEEPVVAPTEPVPGPEPIHEAEDHIPEDTQPPTTVNDTLWQSWWNRLGPALAARMKRPTLLQKEAPVLENEPIAVAPEPEEIPNQPAENWNEIFKEIGHELRTRREMLSLHFDEVERNTHVKTHYLDALERGALDELPSTVQTRGMLSVYATFLDLDVETLLLRFADALQARHRERNPQKPARKPGQPIIANLPPVRSFIAGDMIFGVSMAILLVGFAIWGVSRVMAIQSQREINPTAPSISDVLLASPDPASLITTPTFLPVESFPGEATVTVEIPTQNVNAEVQLNLVAVERTYMRVIVDGEVAFDGRVVPGNAYPFEAENQIEVLVGSGAAIRTVYNGRDLGMMGTFGQVVNNIYSGTEIITPTALPTTTPTITLTPTNTAPPTATSRFTETPVPSATAVP